MFVTELSPNIISNAFTAVGSKLLKNSDYRQCSSLFATSPQVIHFHRWLLDKSTYIVPISWVFVKQLKVQKYNILDYQHQRSRIQYIFFSFKKGMSIWALWTPLSLHTGNGSLAVKFLPLSLVQRFMYIFISFTRTQSFCSEVLRENQSKQIRKVWVPDFEHLLRPHPSSL